MKHAECDHAIRAAGSVLGETEILVIGSRAIHGSISGDVPAEAERSIEVDIVAFDDANARKADLIDGSIGEASTFHETVGSDAEGVSETTAVLPEGWRGRLVRYESPMTNGVVAGCLDLHDLWRAKAIVRRSKDYEFCRSLVNSGLVNTDTLATRLRSVPDLANPVHTAVATLIDSPSQSH